MQSCLFYNYSVLIPKCPEACNITGCQSNSQTDCWDYSGAGGGGSGGSIYLTAKYVNVGELHPHFSCARENPLSGFPKVARG